jgi:hypothetical protein
MEMSIMKAHKKLILVLVIGVLFIISMACTSGSISPSAPASGTAEPANKVLSEFSLITGTKILVAGVYQGENRSGLDFSLSSGREYSYNVYNYVFFDMDSEQFHALLPTNEYAILNKIGLPVSNDGTGSIKWWLYYVVKADTNQDKQLSNGDKFTVSISDIGGNNYVELVPDVDESLGQFMKSDTVLFFFYRQNDKKYYAKIDLQNRSVIATTEYPSFGSDVK